MSVHEMASEALDKWMKEKPFDATFTFVVSLFHRNFTADFQMTETKKLKGLANMGALLDSVKGSRRMQITDASGLPITNEALVYSMSADEPAKNGEMRLKIDHEPMTVMRNVNTMRRCRLFLFTNERQCVLMTEISFGHHGPALVGDSCCVSGLTISLD